MANINDVQKKINDCNLPKKLNIYDHAIISTKVFCTLSFEATHCWPECPFDEVGYLKYPHRHLFMIKAVKVVDHNDRDCEFIMLKHNILQYLETAYPDHNIGSKSCEMLAGELVSWFGLQECSVSEDGENGSIVTVDIVSRFSDVTTY